MKSLLDELAAILHAECMDFTRKYIVDTQFEYIKFEDLDEPNKSYFRIGANRFIQKFVQYNRMIDRSYGRNP